MARNNSRRNYIKLAWIGLGIVILFGLFANINQTFVPGFDAVPYNVPLPLSVIQALDITDPNSLIECRIWTEGTIKSAGLDSTATITTQAPFVTEIFDPNISGAGLLSVLDIRGDEIQSINLDVRMRCDPRAGAFGSISPDDISFTLTGGTIVYQWTSIDGDGSTKQITSVMSNTLPTGNILFDPNSSGVKLVSTTITGAQIDNALKSTREVYFTAPKLIVTVKPDFKFSIPAVFLETESKDVTVVLNSNVPTVKIFNQILDAPTPQSQIVKLVQPITTIPENLYDNSEVASIRVRIQLPNWNEAEGSPTFTLSRPSTTGNFVEVNRDIPVTGKKIIDSSTNTYEFFITSFRLQFDPNTPEGQQGLLKSGQWLVEANHPFRTGQDTGLFNVYNTFVQPEPQTKTKEGGTAAEGDSQIPREQESKPPSEDNGVSGFLNIGDFIGCFQSTDAGSCLNDQKFYVIYGIFGIIILLSVVTGRR
jgi:hypothetical protein